MPAAGERQKISVDDEENLRNKRYVCGDSDWQKQYRPQVAKGKGGEHDDGE